MARRSTDNQHSLGPARALSREEQEKQQKPAGLDQPWLVLQRSLFSSWVNVLLLLVPVGIASHPAKFPEVAIFLINFFAIVPLAKVLGYATEQLALHLGDTLGGLLNATFGNAVELLVGILALVKGKIEIVQTSLVGSILSNLLLVGGCCFLFGGIKNNEQVFNTHAAQSYGSLLAMAILSTLLPAAYNSLHAKDTELKSGTLTLSHVTAIFLLVIYIAYLFFQLKTHANLFLAVPMHERRVAALKPGKATAEVPGAARNRKDTLEACEEAGLNEGDDDEEELPELTTTAAIVLLLGITALTSVCAEFLVDSIDGLTTKWNLSSSFVGMILLPIVGNAAEHVTAVTVAIRNKMDLALGVAVGSSIQIALFVMPFLCILGWIIGQPMTIYFSPFTTVVLFVTVLLVNYIIGDGRTNWLEGLVLIMAYAIIGVAYFLYPKNMDTSSTSL
ncbi:vacuolar Ca/H(+) exchanger [Coemansia reversa NRRL 1564]|uniref:Vacuolar Ca/H(+) exchanger n=1 Tax=Coemansia reversa (strain ATCC 12441 / NRRL 1564) TaxID=763665 RepID=A0A2G5B3R5_COERN|nr:vacuolar Ca/H(+) exchanger [Coemansia reversa NRRL 1564]|eukprot:PIA13656.1 vacuolar Ca/H(+) exchanger [Coemansia reversa NRRL 1564]